jgi:hypothetical protein
VSVATVGATSLVYLSLIYLPCAASAEIALCGILVYGIHTAYAPVPGSAQGTR